MSQRLHPEEYTESHTPIATVVEFFKGKLTELGWDRSNKREIIMDVGCGPGGTTKDVILPFFPKIEKIIALDAMAGMINIAREKNADVMIEYVLADITQWSTVQEWEQEITKLLSIHCFHWVKDQKQGFENIHRLLVRGGEAAFFFVLEATYFDAIEHLQNNSRWSRYLKSHDNGIPKSHYRKYGAAYYRQLMEEIGFDVLHCKKEEKIDVYSSEETLKTFFLSLCVLAHHIPERHKEEFKNDLVREVLERNVRTATGLPYHRGQMLELIVRKRLF